MNAAVASAQRSGDSGTSAADAGAGPGAVAPRSRSHSARVGSCSTFERLRPHAAQNTPAPGGSPQNGQTRSLGCMGGILPPAACGAARLSEKRPQQPARRARVDPMLALEAAGGGLLGGGGGGAPPRAGEKAG